MNYYRIKIVFASRTLEFKAEFSSFINALNYAKRKGRSIFVEHFGAYLVSKDYDSQVKIFVRELVK